MINKRKWAFLLIVCLLFGGNIDISSVAGNPNKFSIESDSSLELDNQKKKFIGDVNLSTGDLIVFADTIIVPSSDLIFTKNNPITGNGNVRIKKSDGSIFLYGEMFSIYHDSENIITSIHVFGEKSKFEQRIDNLPCGDLLDGSKSVTGNAKKIIYFPQRDKLRLS